MFIVAGIIAAAVGAFMAIPGSMVGGTLPGGIAIGLGCMLIGMAVHGYYREAAYRDLDRPDHRWREPGGDVVYIVEKD